MKCFFQPKLSTSWYVVCNQNYRSMYHLFSSLYLKYTATFQWFCGLLLFVNLFFMWCLRRSMVICKKQTHTSARNCTNTGSTAVGSIIVWITITPCPHPDPTPLPPLPHALPHDYCLLLYHLKYLFSTYSYIFLRI